MTCASIAPVVKDVHYRGNENGLLVILGGPALLVPLEPHRKSFRWWVNHASAHNKNNRIASKGPCPQCVVVSQMLPISMAIERGESLVGRLPIARQNTSVNSSETRGEGHGGAGQRAGGSARPHYRPCCEVQGTRSKILGRKLGPKPGPQNQAAQWARRLG